MPASSRRRNQRGVSMYFGALSFFMIVPIVGLSIDVGFLYAVKARLQASVDGASLAAARALNLGQTTGAQATAAKTNAVNWFYANYPLGAWGSYGTQMDSSTVDVFDDPNNPRVRNVTVAASTNVKTYFLGWLRVTSSLVRAQGNASRRDVVVMIVLDRSGSMQLSGACGPMRNAAKLFTGQFAAGRDRIGLVSYSDNVYLHTPPTQDFQNVLGYTNSSGSGNGMIDTIQCAGGTSTAQAISVAYNELYKVNLPGALNVIMFETDGLPNTLTLNFWDSVNNVAAISNTSPCKDKNNKTKAGGGFNNAASIPAWSPLQPLGVGSYFSDIPAGIVGGIYSADPNSTAKARLVWKYWTTSTSVNSQEITPATPPSPAGCTFLTYPNTANTEWPFPLGEFSWLPMTDVWGNSLTSTNYKTVTTSGGHVQANSWTNYHNAALNATDAAAYQARTNVTLPVHFFGIGLGGGTNPPDYVLLQRMANDPRGDNYNRPALYPPCSQSPGCVTHADQPQGTFIFSANQASLSQAFLSISSEVLRLSK